MFHLVLSCQIVRKLLVSGAHSSGGGTFSQPPPPFVSHATARTPRAQPTRSRERGRVVVFRATQSAAHARLDARRGACEPGAS